MRLTEQLRHRITIQKKSIELNASDDRVPHWSDVKTVWAAVKPLSVRDFLAARAMQYKTAARIVIRFTNDLNGEDYRLYHADTQLYYRIEGILPDAESGKEYLTIACEKGVYEWEDLP